MFTLSFVVETNDTEGKKHIPVTRSFARLLTSSSTHPPVGKEASALVCKFKNCFSKKKFPIIENSMIKSLTCFKYQIDTTAVQWNFLPLVINY